MKVHVHISGISFATISPLLMAWSKISDIELADIDQNDVTVLTVTVNAKFRVLFGSICRTIRARGGRVVMGATRMEPLDLKSNYVLPSSFAGARFHLRSDVAGTAQESETR
jgi:hypothetical protein